MVTAVRALGEVALRTSQLDRMQAFYADVIGLELLRRFDTVAFFKLAEGYGGHTAVLAIFDRGDKEPGKQTPLDHLAFTIALADYESELERLRSLGLDVLTAEHGWVHWRSMYVNDPDGNTVELVCFDPSVD